MGFQQVEEQKLRDELSQLVNPFCQLHLISSDWLILHANWSVLTRAAGKYFAYYFCQLEETILAKKQKKE